MAITIDYFLKRDTEEEDEKVLMLAVSDEDELIKVFNSDEIEAISEYLAMRTRIITYDNTIRNLYPYLTRDFILEHEINKKVFNMFNYLKKETAHDITLSQLALATLGIDMGLTRLPRNYDDSQTDEIQEKLETRVKYIQRLWDFGIQYGYLIYYIKGNRNTVEVNFVDSIDA